MAQHVPIALRFWPKVDRSGGPDACWPWTAYRDHLGYGRISLRSQPSRVARAPRIALEFGLGRPLGPGLEACHTCDNPPCCNPAHLYEGTHAQNMGDMIRQGRGIAGLDLWGEAHPRAHLTAPDVSAIRAADLSRYGSQIALARRLGVTRETIREIRIGKRWSHLMGAQ